MTLLERVPSSHCAVVQALLISSEEGDQILRHEKYNLLNRRGEWGQNLPPKLGVEEQVTEAEKRKSTGGSTGGTGSTGQSSKRCKTESNMIMQGNQDPPSGTGGETLVQSGSRSFDIPDLEVCKILPPL